MHVEIQVALNFVISYLYNKLPRRRVNLFGEELEKALKDRFQGHWYPEKPFKGSAFRCLKTGDPIDAVLDRAARESGVPITDILENLPAELSVWVDPGEVSYRIGEKGAVKILYSESNDLHDDSCADREVTKTFNPEAQCFRPIDAVSNNLSQLCLSPKTSPDGSPSTASTTSPTATAATNGSSLIGSAVTNNKQILAATSPAPATTAFLPRSQAPLTFTTATFAQTKFGSTKLKTSSKRSNSRMSPTEFSNYIKQRAMQQQLHHSHGHSNNAGNHLGPIGSVSPSRSISPNPLAALHQPADSYYFPNNNNNNNNNNGSNTNNAMSLYLPFNNGRNNTIFDSPQFSASSLHGDSLYGNTGSGKFGGSNYLEPQNFYGMSGLGAIGAAAATNTSGSGPSAMNNVGSPMNAPSGVLPNASGGGNSLQSAGGSSPSSSGSGSESSKLLDGLSSFYSNAGPYQHLLVAN